MGTSDFVFTLERSQMLKLTVLTLFLKNKIGHRRNRNIYSTRVFILYV